MPSPIPPTTNSFLLTSSETPEVAIYENEMDQNDKMDQNISNQVNSNDMSVIETSLDRSNKRNDFQSGPRTGPFPVHFRFGTALPVVLPVRNKI